SGRINVSGAGRWDAEAGPTGEVAMELREGWASSDEAGVEASGIEADLRTMDLLGGTLPAGQALRVAKVAVAGTEVRDTRVAFGLDAAQVAAVGSVEAIFLGGRVKLKPFSVALADPKVVAAADVDALQLGEVATLMPWLLNAAQGKLRGRVELAWDEAKGLRVRDGGLDIVKSDDAVFRLAPSPGLLTGSMEDRFRFFPNVKWARWIGLNNPAYAPLKAIEQGREGLRIETFRVNFWPDGLGTGRPATIHIVGKPTSGKLVEEVKMDVNFYGPLTEAMGFGLNQEFTGFNFVIQ
ncbi:MAG: YdbH domain-containing protein, partial [Burkholderiales bacterium]|nr:YdbH domain-containing protein [Opitutaceae bacterium]